MARLWAAEAEHHSTVLRLERSNGSEERSRSFATIWSRRSHSLDDEQQDVAAEVFNHLVTPSGTKIAHDASDLAGYLGTTSQQLEPVLALLAAQRILRPVPASRVGLPRYEIYHDILADAVLAWRARHDSHREVERVREAAARRHRRLLVIAVAAVLLAGAMAGTTIFAFTQRGEAQRQAERAIIATRLATRNAARATLNYNTARRAERRAERNAKRALAQKTRADRNAEAATTEKKRAQKEQRKAEQNAKVAVSEKNRADASAKTATNEKQRADANATKASNETQVANANLATAQKAEAQAVSNAREATRNAQRAQANEQRAQGNAQRAQAQALAATALTEVSTAPEQALTDALQSAELDPSGAENVLRQALDASRVPSQSCPPGARQAVSRSVQTALFSSQQTRTSKPEASRASTE